MLGGVAQVSASASARSRSDLFRNPLVTCGPRLLTTGLGWGMACAGMLQGTWQQVPLSLRSPDDMGGLLNLS